MVSLIGYGSFCAMIWLSGNELNYNGNLSLLNGAVLVAIFQCLSIANKVGKKEIQDSQILQWQVCLCTRMSTDILTC